MSAGTGRVGAALEHQDVVVGHREHDRGEWAAGGSEAVVAAVKAVRSRSRRGLESSH